MSEGTEGQNQWLRLAPRPRARPAGVKWDVFISYRSLNRAWALALYDSLREAHFEVFLDQFVLPVGTGIEGFLRDNLQASAGGVVVWSGDAATSKFVDAELRTMRHLKEKRADFFYALAKLDETEPPFLEEGDLYVDFSSYPEGPRGGELLRLMFGVLGQPLSDQAAREIQALDVAAAALVKRIRAAKAAGNTEALHQVAQDGGPALTATAVPYGALVEALIELGSYPEALEVVAQARAQFPRALRLQQLEALAYRRTGRIEDAQEILTGLYEDGHRDPETVGILAATWMQRFKQDHKKIYLERSQSLYAEAFKLAPDSYYNGINVASKAALLGRPDDAQKLAAAVLPLVEKHEDGRDYWATATHAEARLLRGEYAAAARLYRAAVVAHLTEAGSIDASRTQAADLLAVSTADVAARDAVMAAFSLE
jgi:tetratricopeptide (TPR) repeat protein